MGDGEQGGTIDLIRWTFSIDPEHRGAIQEYLEDLGLDVLAREGTHFVVLWDEPEGNIDEVIEEMWELHGSAFEITQEEFHRQTLLQVHQDEGGDERAVA